mgnify:CR=1 FL=1
MSQPDIFGICEIKAQTTLHIIGKISKTVRISIKEFGLDAPGGL